MKLLSALVSLALLAQSGIPVDGTVRDSHGQPVSNAAVRLKTERQTFTANTGTDGRYRFQAVPAGSYTLHAEFSGRGEVTFGPFTLSERKTVDLTLSPAKPEFFDEPTFIVAGVSDGSARGGHGSDAILRSSEALTKAAASLGKESTVDTAPLEAVREYQRAAELDPSERNLFDWGSELLAHRAHDPAIEVFTRGNRLFPKSTRMLLGLAVAYYAKGSYDLAARRFFDATDTEPGDRVPYILLAKVQSDVITESDGFLDRMRRFAELKPESASANYYYAVSLWKQKRAAEQVKALLDKAIRLDPTLAVARLELGIVYMDQKQYPQAIAAFDKAIEINPRMEEAHYRLGQVYARTGEKLKAQKEFEIHDRLARESAAQVERQRREVQQFVIELRHPQ